MIVLSIALIVHLYNAIICTPPDQYPRQADRIAAAVRSIEVPARYTALTTAAGFFAIAFSPVPPLSAFGLAAAIGVLVIYGLVMFIVPPILSHWGKAIWQTKPKDTGKAGASKRFSVDALIDFASISLHRPGWTLTLALTLIVMGAPLITRIVVETDMTQLLPKDHILTRTTDHYETHFSGITTIEVVFDAAETDGLLEPDILKDIRAFEAWAEDQPEIDYAISMADIVEELNWAFNSEMPEARIVPDNRRLISQYLFVYDGDDLYDLVDSDFARARLPLLLNVHGARETNRVIDMIRAQLQASDLNVSWRIAGGGRLFADFEALVLDSQMRSAIIAFTIIFCLMAFYWRSFAQAALLMVPNVAPLAVVFILMGLFGMTLNVGTVLISSVILGIAVDDTIHMFSAYKKRLAVGLPAEDALRGAMRSTGRAVVATTFILCASFVLLAWSNFLPTSQFGMMTTIGLVTALLFDLFLLPATLVLLHRFGRDKSLFNIDNDIVSANRP